MDDQKNVTSHSVYFVKKSQKSTKAEDISTNFFFEYLRIEFVDLRVIPPKAESIEYA